MFQPQQKLITLGNTKLKFLSVNKNCRFFTRVLDNEHSISSNLGSQGERENFVYFAKYQFSYSKILQTILDFQMKQTESPSRQFCGLVRISYPDANPNSLRGAQHNIPRKGCEGDKNTTRILVKNRLHADLRHPVNQCRVQLTITSQLLSFETLFL